MIDDRGDPIAYLNLVEDSENIGRFNVEADLSGRHFQRGHEVVAVLEELQKHLGGSLESDD
jgi:hypothetical protein